MKHRPLAKRERQHGFTLVEIMISSFIIIVVVGVALATFLSLIKMQQRIQSAADSGIEIQRAMRTIYDTTVASPAAPVVQDANGNTVAAVTVPGTPPVTVASGVAVRIAPAEKHYLMITGGTDVLDAATNTLGYNNTRTSISLSDVSPQATTYEILQDGAPCPASQITTADPSVFSVDKDLRKIANPGTELFSVGDKVFLPITAYGDGRQLTINSLSSNSLTFTTQLNPTSTTWKLPNGTLIANTAGPRALIKLYTIAAAPFERGDLVYFPDDRDNTKYKILAKNIDPTPRSIPSDPTSALERPFTYITDEQTNIRELLINLQSLPAGNSMTGRTTNGIRTRIKVRTPSDYRDL